MSASNRITENIRSRRNDAIAAAAILLISLGSWWIWRPGIYTTDSLSQVEQAVTGRFSDWHPPALSIALRYWLLAGGGLSAWILLQCASGFLGAFAFAREVVRTWRRNERRSDEPLLAGIATLAFALLPPSSLFLCRLTKDVPFFIAFLWMMTFGLRMCRSGPTRARFIAFTTMATICLLVRHNALVILPPIGIYILTLFRERGRATALGAAAVVPVVWFAVTIAIYSSFDIERLHIIREVKAYELVAACHARPELCNDFPYTRHELMDYFATGPDEKPGVPNFIERLYYLGGDILKRYDGERIDAEYAAMWRRAPLELIGFRIFALIRTIFRPLHMLVDESSEAASRNGLDLSPSMRPARMFYRSYANRIGASPAGFLVASHAVWVGLTLAAFGAMSYLAIRGSMPKSFAMLAFIPVAYLMGYAVFPFDPEFRYLYPVTATAQIAFAVSGMAAVTRKLRRRRSEDRILVSQPTP